MRAAMLAALAATHQNSREPLTVFPVQILHLRVQPWSTMQAIITHTQASLGWNP